MYLHCIVEESNTAEGLPMRICRSGTRTGWSCRLSCAFIEASLVLTACIQKRNVSNDLHFTVVYEA